MGKIFKRKQFSDYLGENRAILDIVNNYYSFVPSPSPTPSPTIPTTATPTPTPSYTPTNTPTISISPTQTPSQTPTISLSPTQTPTISLSPTQTPTPSTTCSTTTQYLSMTVVDNDPPISLLQVWEDINFTISGTAVCNYNVVGWVISNYNNQRTSQQIITTGQHSLLYYFPVWTFPGEFTMTTSIIGVPTTSGCTCPVILYPNGVTPTPTPTKTPTQTPTATPTPTPSSTPTTFDADAALYLAEVLNQGGTLDDTISGATNTLFTDLKSNGLYTKLDVLYLMLGGTSGSTSLNAIRTNNAFDISWVNTVDLSFGYSGVTGGGSGYGRMNYIPDAEAIPTDISFGIYHTAGNFGQANGEQFTWGGFDGTNLISNYYNSGTNLYSLYGWSTSWNTIDQPIGTQGADGSWIGTFDTTDKNIYHNISSNDSAITGTTGGAAVGTAQLSTQEFYLFTLNINGSPYSPYFFTGRIQSMFVGEYLTPSQVDKIDELINNFHTTIGRNLY